MRTVLHRWWLILPVIASIATQCGESPRGAAPSPVATVVLRLDSQPAPDPAPEDAAAFASCLVRMNDVNNVVPSWQGDRTATLTESAPNVFTRTFNDVPTGLPQTMLVHDRNECRRNPLGSGRVTMGVTANGTPIERRLGSGFLSFVVETDGTVLSPPVAPAP